MAPSDSPTMDGLPLTRPTAKQVIELGHDTLTRSSFRPEEFGDSRSLHPKSLNRKSTHRRALLGGEARDRLGRERRVLNGPGRSAIARLEDPRTSARVANQRGWAGHRRQGRGSRRWCRVGPRRSAVVGHDDGGIVPTVVAHGHTRCRGAWGAGDGADVGQWLVRGPGLPLRGDGARRWRRQRAPDDSDDACRHRRQERCDSNSYDPPHGHPLISRYIQLLDDRTQRHSKNNGR